MSYCANISKFQTNMMPLTHKHMKTHVFGLVQAFQEKGGWAKQVWWAQNENDFDCTDLMSSRVLFRGGSRISS